jgi:hypothetical protein
VPATPSAASLGDDVAEAYVDILYGITLWRLGTPDARADAAFQWRWGYEHHWGDHLFLAITTVHEARYQAIAD